jgi:hypothetical protein
VKKILLSQVAFFKIISVLARDPAAGASAFNPVIKFKALLHARYKYSLTDSVDVQGKYAADPLIKFSTSKGRDSKRY